MEGIASAGCPCATRLPPSAQRGDPTSPRWFWQRITQIPRLRSSHGPSLKFPPIKSQWKITLAWCPPPHLPPKAEQESSAAPVRIKQPSKGLWCWLGRMIHISRFWGFGSPSGSQDQPREMSAGPSSCLRTLGHRQSCSILPARAPATRQPDIYKSLFLDDLHGF